MLKTPWCWLKSVILFRDWVWPFYLATITRDHIYIYIHIHIYIYMFYSEGINLLQNSYGNVRFSWWIHHNPPKQIEPEKQSMKTCGSRHHRSRAKKVTRKLIVPTETLKIHEDSKKNPPKFAYQTNFWCTRHWASPARAQLQPEICWPNHNGSILQWGHPFFLEQLCSGKFLVLLFTPK